MNLHIGTYFSWVFKHPIFKIGHPWRLGWFGGSPYNFSDSPADERKKQRQVDRWPTRSKNVETRHRFLPIVPQKWGGHEPWLDSHWKSPWGDRGFLQRTGALVLVTRRAMLSVLSRWEAWNIPAPISRDWWDMKPSIFFGVSVLAEELSDQGGQVGYIWMILNDMYLNTQTVKCGLNSSFIWTIFGICMNLWGWYIGYILGELDTHHILDCIFITILIPIIYRLGCVYTYPYCISIPMLIQSLSVWIPIFDNISIF